MRFIRHSINCALQLPFIIMLGSKIYCNQLENIFWAFHNTKAMGFALPIFFSGVEVKSKRKPNVHHYKVR